MECVLGKIKGHKENVVCRSMHTMQTMFLKVYNRNEFIENHDLSTIGRSWQG